MIGLLVAIVVLLSITLIVLIIGVLLYVKRLDDAVRETSDTLRALREGILPLASDIRRLTAESEELVIQTRAQVQSSGRVIQALENLLEGRTIVEAAGKAVETSRITVVSVLQGVKEGLKTLRSSRHVPKEDSTDEQP